MIFITGGTGHTGSRAVRRLHERGRAVRCLIHTPANRRYLPAGADVVQGDALDPAALAAAMQGATACLHLAHIRLAGPVLEACAKSGIGRFLCMSSTRRFTAFPCESSRAVIAGEAAVEASGLRWTILRPSMIYGGDRDNNIEILVRHFRRMAWFPLVGKGRQLVQPVFTRDVVAAIEAALERPQSEGRSYTLAGPEPMEFRRMIELVARAAGREPRFFPAPYSLAFAAAWLAERVLPRLPATTEQIRRFLEDKVFDIRPARRDLDFSPIPFEEGLRRKLAGEA